MTNAWVKVGARVVFKHSWGGYSDAVRTIEKVYKNGNFTLNGSSQQFRPTGYAERAKATGSKSYISDTCVHLTDDVRADIERQAELRAAKLTIREEISRLEGIRGEDPLIEEARRIKSRSQP